MSYQKEDQGKPGCQQVVSYVVVAVRNDVKRRGPLPARCDEEDLAHDVYVELCEEFGGPTGVENAFQLGAGSLHEALKQSLAEATRNAIQRVRYSHKVEDKDGDPDGIGERRRRRPVPSDVRLEVEILDPTAPGDTPKAHDRVIDVKQALETLPEDERAILVRHAIDGDSMWVIAAERGLTTKKVRGILDKVKDKLKRALDDYEFDRQ